jgi:Fe-S-cluster containining protein
MPCYPCPHNSVCCSWGTSLNLKEADVLRAKYGADAVVWDDEEKEWRTRVDDGRCMFLSGNSCSLHELPEYPSVCREFPWRDPETGGPYQYDLSICPEFPDEPDEP